MTTQTRATRMENPLVPDAVLRAMYTRMVEARLLEQHLGSLRRKQRGGSLAAEVACRAAAAQCLKPGDLVSDFSENAAADLLLGVSLREIKRHLKSSGAGIARPLARHRLPRETDTGQQLVTALGAAHALKVDGTQRMLLVICQPLPDTRMWRNVLGQAGRHDLPILFLCSSSRSSPRREAMVPGLLSDRARAWGVPGIPVDGSDGVALYRVLSEATVRARAGDGPTLVEGVAWRLPGSNRGSTADPLIAMALALLARGVATTRWQAGVAERIRASLRRW